MKCEQLDKLLKVNKSWMEFVIDVTKVYQLKEKQRGRIAKDQLDSDEGTHLMTRLSGEMITIGTMLEAESYRIVAERDGG